MFLKKLTECEGWRGEQGDEWKGGYLGEENVWIRVINLSYGSNITENRR